MKVLAFLRGKKEDWEMTATALLPFFCKVFSLRKRGIHESTSSKGTDPVSGLRDIVFHGVFSLPLFGGLSYNAIYDKNYAK